MNYMYQNLLTSLENGIYLITINRADKLNALNRSVIHDLGKATEEIMNNKEIKAAIITGSGEKAFVAGADISQFNGLSVEEGIQLAREGQQVFFGIENCSKPVVAAVNGFALGGGCELAMACHFRIGSDQSKFGQPEVNLGLIPGYGGTQRLVQLIGKGRAMELLLSGTIIDAATALRYGLINYIVSPEELIPKTRAVLDLIISRAPLAVSSCIKAVNAAFQNNNGYQVELESFGACFGTEDMKEGASAFLEKRKPRFTGK